MHKLTHVHKHTTEHFLYNCTVSSVHYSNVSQLVSLQVGGEFAAHSLCIYLHAQQQIQYLL